MIQTADARNQELQSALQYIRSRISHRPKIGVILGSGLGDFADLLAHTQRLPSREIPNYPAPTVAGHEGTWVFGQLNQTTVLAVQGRPHLYEGYPPERIAYMIRLMGVLGIESLLVTNAVGSTHSELQPGSLMIIEDHINLSFKNPLIGLPFPSEQRFPDMCAPYHPAYITLLEKTAQELAIPIRRGVLAVCLGPSYETAAEIKMIRTLGADAVSMSTVPEVLTACARGIKTAGLSCITNLGTGLSKNPLSHQEVIAVSRQVSASFQALIKAFILKLDSSDT